MNMDPKWIDDMGFPQDDVRKLVNSVIYMDKYLPAGFTDTEHERMNLVYFAREFIAAEKIDADSPQRTRPPRFVYLPNEKGGDDDDTDEESDSV